MNISTKLETRQINIAETEDSEVDEIWAKSKETDKPKEPKMPTLRVSSRDKIVDFIIFSPR